MSTFAAVKCWLLIIWALFPLALTAGTARPADLSSPIDEASFHRGILRPVGWLMDYLKNANRETGRPFDCSFICGPTYKSTTSFALGGGMTGLYKWDRNDPALQQSSVNLFFNASVTGMLKLSLEGHNYMRGDRQRWDYELYVENLPTDFWGIGYRNGVRNENKSSYHQIRASFKPNYLFRLAPSFYLGPELRFQHSHSFKVRRPDYLEGQQYDITSTGLGIAVQYDSRDFALNAYRGNFIRIEQLFFPKFMNTYWFNSTELTIRSYRQAWRGGVLAMDLHGLFNYGGPVPWTMLSLVGGNGRMRGYYEGRYRDRNILEGQVELRQHLFGRFGCVVWAGAANVFHDRRHIYMNEVLPSVGTGVRWEFKRRVNIRLDFGLTKNKPGFEFSINEAF